MLMCAYVVVLLRVRIFLMFLNQTFFVLILLRVNYCAVSSILFRKPGSQQDEVGFSLLGRSTTRRLRSENHYVRALE